MRKGKRSDEDDDYKVLETDQLVIFVTRWGTPHLSYETMLMVRPVNLARERGPGPALKKPLK